MITCLSSSITKRYHASQTIILWMFLFVTTIITVSLIQHSLITIHIVQILCISTGIISLAIHHKHKSPNYLRVGGIIGLSTLVGGLLFYYIRDVSVDGNTYHLQAIVDLYHGLNLFDQSTSSIRLSYYPKTIEILFAGIGSFFNNPDQGRILKLVLIIVTLGNVLYTYDKHSAKGTTTSSLLIAIVIVLNPVVLYQFFTLYIDDVLYLLFINSMLYWFNKETTTALLTIAIVASSKISYLLFGGLGLVVCTIITSLYHHQSLRNQITQRRSEITSHRLIKRAALLIIILVGLHQYIINGYYFHNPLYGFVGEGKKDIITMFQPPRMRTQNKLHKFVTTYTSYSRSFCVINDCLKPINLRSRSGIKEFITSYKSTAIYDPNINGFGNLYPILLILSLIAAGYSTYHTKAPYSKTTYYILGLMIGYIVLCTALLPFAWARYLPILYLVPLIITSRVSPSSRWHKIIIIGYLCNMGLIIGFTTLMYTRNALYKMRQEYFISTQQVSSISYTTFIEGSYFSSKFLGVYHYTFDGMPAIELSKDQFLEACGISSYQPIYDQYAYIAPCPNGGYALRGDYGGFTDEYFYIK